MYNRPYRFEFSDTSSPENYTLLRPDFVIICFDINERRSLVNAQEVWMKDVIRLYQRYREDVPVMLLGLKRDERKEGEGIETIYPQEVDSANTQHWSERNSLMVIKGYRIAQEMRCDRYAECSAMTGELINETFEDIARTAAKTTTENGGLADGGCAIL